MDADYVIFLINDIHNDIFAFFPKKNKFIRTNDSFNKKNINVNYIKQSRIAKYNEYFLLKNELENKGYNLQIING